MLNLLSRMTMIAGVAGVLLLANYLAGEMVDLPDMVYAVSAAMVWFLVIQVIEFFNRPPTQEVPIFAITQSDEGGYIVYQSGVYRGVVQPAGKKFTIVNSEGVMGKKKYPTWESAVRGLV